MKRFSPWNIFLVLALFVSACTPQTAPVTSIIKEPTRPAAASAPTMPPPTATNTIAPSTTPPPVTLTPSPLPPTPTPIPQQIRPHYTLNVDFSYDQHGGRVDELIQYRNNASQPLTDMHLIVPLYQYRDAFRISGLAWIGGARDGQTVENAALDNTEIVFPLPQPLQPGEALGLRVTYDFTLPSQSQVSGDRPLPIGYTSRQVNLVDWYAFIPPFQDGLGWLVHPPAYYGEHLVFELSDFEVNLHLTDARKDLVVAASAAAKQDGEWLRYQFPGARTFALSISHEFQVEKAQLGEITVSSYYFASNELAGKRALKTTVQALDLYARLFGFYPHYTLAVVEADFFDGMEYDGLYFLSRAFYNLHKGDAGDYLVAIAAHETAHQWWYGVVGNDQANEPWLDEALSTYTERIFYENYYPDALSWWWQYRIQYYHPAGWVDTTVYNPQGQLQTYQDYRNAVYLNGAKFFEDLRKLVGDEAFFAFLKDYATTYAGKIAFRADFFAILAKHSQADLKPLLEKYFYNH